MAGPFERMLCPAVALLTVLLNGAAGGSDEMLLF